MDMSSRQRGMTVAAGVLSGFAIAYGILEVYGWFKRAGKINLDFITIIKFFVYTIGALSNVFLTVSFGSAVWWIIMYKVSKNYIKPCSIYVLTNMFQIFLLFLRLE